MPQKGIIMWISECIEQQTHSSWHSILESACKTLPTDYLDYLEAHSWLPGKDKIFKAFQLPLQHTQYILYGESPYPRAISANGFAFWDNAVKEIWSPTGLSKTVNRATSLRNIIKMLLLAEGCLPTNFTTEDIITLEKTNFIQTLPELFNNLLKKGFLLLNASLALSELQKIIEARHWLNFHKILLAELEKKSHSIELILFGKIAEKIISLPESKNFPKLIAQHPYNLGFIKAPEVIQFFKPLHLLRR